MLELEVRAACCLDGRGKAYEPRFLRVPERCFEVLWLKPRSSPGLFAAVDDATIGLVRGRTYGLAALRALFVLACLMLNACAPVMYAPGGIQSPSTETSAFPLPSLPMPTPRPALRIFECDGGHCHQVFHVSADLGGKFYLEGVHEHDTLMTYEGTEAKAFLDPIGPPERMETIYGPLVLTPFMYEHRIGRVGDFHVTFRRTVCDGRSCAYVARGEPAPPEHAAEFYVSSSRAFTPSRGLVPISR